jgi:Domain of unknown function (DUF1848)
MIISASRRTDIPAFYARWFINRVREGWCSVPNPFNPQQVSMISLAPRDVDVIVFWTRNPRPLFASLKELDERGFLYYFQFTLMNNPRLIDQHNPPLRQALDAFRFLADRIGPERVIWRYDPIVLSEFTPPDFHRRTYSQLAQELRGYTSRSVISFLDVYAKIRRRLDEIGKQGAVLLESALVDPITMDLPSEIAGLSADLADLAAQNQMEIVSCAEGWDLKRYGISSGKCIDDVLIWKTFGLDVNHLKDPGQRKACGCIASKDIGMYNTCLFGCSYCYATSSFEKARLHYQQHDPKSLSIY